MSQKHRRCSRLDPGSLRAQERNPSVQGVLSHVLLGLLAAQQLPAVPVIQAACTEKTGCTSSSRESGSLVNIRDREGSKIVLNSP